MAAPVNQDHALLVGMIAGALTTFDERLGPVTLEDDGRGNYTGRIFIDRPRSGRWVLTVAPDERESAA